MYTSAFENVHLCLRTVNWVTLVSLLVEYLLYFVLRVCSLCHVAHGVSIVIDLLAQD